MRFEYNGYTLEIEKVKDDKGITKYYTAHCAEVPYFPSGIFKTDLAFIIEYFRHQVNAYTFSELNKMTNLKDQDVILADQFSEAIDNLIEEILLLIYAKNLYYIVNIKVKRVYEFFKDTVLYGCSFDQFRENIISKIRVIKREEDKKKEYPVLTEFNNVLEYIKRDSQVYSTNELVDKLNSVHQLYGSVLNLSLDEVKKKYFELTK